MIDILLKFFTFNKFVIYYILRIYIYSETLINRQFLLIVSPRKKMTEKCKRLVLDLNQKIEINKHLKKGETATTIALIYGVGQ